MDGRNLLNNGMFIYHLSTGALFRNHLQYVDIFGVLLFLSCFVDIMGEPRIFCHILVIRDFPLAIFPQLMAILRWGQ